MAMHKIPMLIDFDLEVNKEGETSHTFFMDSESPNDNLKTTNNCDNFD